MKVETYESWSLKNVSISKQPLLFSQTAHQVERRTDFVRRYGLRKCDDHTDTRASGGSTQRFAHFLDRLLYRACSERNVYGACTGARNGQHQSGSVTETAVELYRPCALRELIAQLIQAKVDVIQLLGS